jgi:hypothetical protein
MMVIAPTRKIASEVGPRPDATAADVRLPAPSVGGGPVPSASQGKPDATGERTIGEVLSRVASRSRTRIDATKTHTTARGRRDALLEPEVLIAQDEAAALRQLLARAGEGRIVGASPATDASGATVDLMPPEIMIPPIKIDPLMAVNGEEGVRQ